MPDSDPPLSDPPMSVARLRPNRPWHVSGGWHFRELRFRGRRWPSLRAPPRVVVCVDLYRVICRSKVAMLKSGEIYAKFLMDGRLGVGGLPNEHGEIGGMKLRCPKCNNEFSAQDVNPSANIAYCRPCAEGFALADLINADPTNDPDAKINLYEPPPGAWFQDYGDGFEVGATTRSWAALVLVPFMMVWSGFSLGGIYGTQIYKGQFNLIESLFGIPFVVGTIILGSITAMAICGKVVISVRNNEEGSVFLGVGRIGYRKKFNWQKIHRVAEVQSHSSGRISYDLVLEGEERVKIGGGSGINDTRHQFIRAVLKAMIAARGLRSRRERALL